MLNDLLKKSLLFLLLSLFVSGLHAWTYHEEEAELNRLIKQFNQSIDVKLILNQFDRSYNEILEMNEELPNSNQVEEMIKMFFNSFKPRQDEIKKFYDRFFKLGEMFSLASVYRRFKCLEYKAETYALDRTMQKSFDRLEQYQKNKRPLPSSKFDYSIIKDVTQKMITFTEEYPSYSNFEFLRREFQFLDQKIKTFYPHHRNDENLRSQIDEQLRNIQNTINNIAQKLQSFYADALKLVENNGVQNKHQLPVSVNYNFLLKSELYQGSSELCNVFRSKILHNASIINRPSYYLISVLILSLFSIRIFV